ncbi:hypothetical protein E3N88_42412 [Mikania micrantha]|uniref:non-specific serine/threonine protein kinase n=1 Tax=Mikania micrantha TaxID=192012 RepID=A0A5N6LIR3_9ASTR|nr:hypothetical protein E3N88_42412 [Mikania micrantha]
MLGDEIGRGSYGPVYKGLDVEKGDFVAIKQVSLENIAPEDLDAIMVCGEWLTCKDHQARQIRGPFPESLAAIYIAQVHCCPLISPLGVVHRDIKGANILTTKEGLVKLADFGLPMKLTVSDGNAQSVTGTPYWMAPEVIEMSGVSAASDIWSVGCTVIELITGVPPHYDLQPMQALVQIVQDENPPMPDNLSPGITDFLLQCFKKDAKLRPDAKTLLAHPWIQDSRRAVQR